MAKRCGLCGFATDDKVAFSEHMARVHEWGPKGPVNVAAGPAASPATSVPSVAWAPERTLAVAVIGSALVALAQLPRVQLVGAFLSSALWFSLTRAGLPRWLAIGLGAVTGLFIAFITRLLIVDVLHLPPEFVRSTTELPDGGWDPSGRQIGADGGLFIWPIMGAGAAFFFTWGNRARDPESLAMRALIIVAGPVFVWMALLLPIMAFYTVKMILYVSGFCPAC